MAPSTSAWNGGPISGFTEVHRPRMPPRLSTSSVSPTAIGGMRLASEAVRPHVVSFLDQMLKEKGVTVRIEKGTEAFVTQSLGGSFTLQIPSYGGLFRLPGRDADAIFSTSGRAR